MKKHLYLIISLLSIISTIDAQMTMCEPIFFETFETNGALPSSWTEYNTTGRLTIENNTLKFNHNASLPSVHHSFTPESDNVLFSWDVSASRNSVSCQLSLLSSTGKYISTVDIGSKSATIKYASIMNAGAPSGLSKGSPEIIFQKNTVYTITCSVNFSSQTLNYYADGILFAQDAPFLETANDIAKVDIKLLYMYSNSGYFYFDNFVLAPSEELRVSLWEEIATAENKLVDSENSDDSYPQEAIDALNSSINSAKIVEGNCMSTESQLSTELADISQAIIAFNNAKAPEKQSINIDALDTKQKVIMVGGDMERNAPAVLKAPNKYEIIKWLILDIPFNTYRVKYDKLQEMTEGNLDLDGAYADQVTTMKLIKLANPDIKFYATMKSDYNGYNQGNRNNLPTFIYDYAYDKTTETTTGTKSFDAVKYGHFLADYIEYMSDNDVPISYLSTSKEWTQVMTATRAKTSIETLIDELDKRDIAMPLIIDPGAWSIQQGYNTVNSYVANDVNKYLYGYSTHNYSKTSKTWTDFVTAANNAGKFAFDDESGHGSGGPTNGAYEMPITTAITTYSKKCDMYAGGIQGECFFELWMSNFSYARPIMFSSTESGQRIRSYYIMKKFAENLVDATYVNQSVNNLDGLSTMSFIKDSSLVLWVINSSERNITDCDIEVSNLGLRKDMTIEHCYWDSTSVITGVDNSLMAEGNGLFSIDLLPRSINCYIINPYSEENQSYLSNHSVRYQSNKLSIYPNPASSHIKIECADAIISVHIFNMKGQEVNSIKVCENSIDISALEIGLYILKGSTQLGDFTTHFIKE